MEFEEQPRGIDARNEIRVAYEAKSAERRSARFLRLVPSAGKGRFEAPGEQPWPFDKQHRGKI